jgi:hypothetical protein
VNYCHLAVVSVDAPGVAAAFDIVEVTSTPHGDVAVPYSFSLFPDLTIHRIYNGWWFVGRPTVEELRQDLRAMMQACRHDYSYEGPPARPASAR